MLKIEVEIGCHNVDGKASANEVRVSGNRIESLETLRKAKDGDFSSAVEIIYNFLIIRGIENAVKQVGELLHDDFEKAMDMALMAAKESLSDEQRMS